MSLLLQTKLLYRSFRMERPATDAAVLQLRDFLVNQFGHEGTAAIREVDESTKMQQTENAGGKTLRRFVHPLAAKRTPVARVQSQPAPLTVAPPLEVKETVVTQTVVGETGLPSSETNGAGIRQEDGTVIPFDGAGGADLGKSEPDTSENLLSPLVNPAAAADKLTIPLSEVADKKAKAVATEYGRERLIATLSEYAVDFKSSASDTQLAAALIQYAKTQG
jgi:hypothetical protein